MNNNPEKKRAEITAELTLSTITSPRMSRHHPNQQVRLPNKHMETNTYDFLDSRKSFPGTIDDANKHVELDLQH